MGSVIVTGTRTKSTATFKGRTRVFRAGVAMVWVASSSVLAFSGAFSTSRDWMWTSFTSAWAKATTGKAQVAATRRKTQRLGEEGTRCDRVGTLLRTRLQNILRALLRTPLRTPLRTRVLGRDGRDPYRRAISTSFGRDSITALLGRLRYFCQMLVKIEKRRPVPGNQSRSGRAVEAIARCHLATIKTFHG